jgi:hypothetical protein
MVFSSVSFFLHVAEPREMYIKVLAQVRDAARTQFIEELLDPAVILLPERDGHVCEQARKMIELVGMAQLDGWIIQAERPPLGCPMIMYAGPGSGRNPN